MPTVNDEEMETWVKLLLKIKEMLHKSAKMQLAMEEAVLILQAQMRDAAAPSLLDSLSDTE